MKRKITFLIMLITPCIACPVISTSAKSAPPYEEISSYTIEIGEEYNICPELLQAIIEHESSCNADAVSNHGAIGLMQVIPKWNYDRMERLGISDLTNSYQNILCGTDLLAELVEKYGDLYLVLMCYNQGEYGGAIEQWESGEYSEYAISIAERAAELEREHGK